LPSHHYIGSYLTVIAVMLLGAAIALGLYLRQRRAEEEGLRDDYGDLGQARREPR
jgi:hypothetical protein